MADEGNENTGAARATGSGLERLDAAWQRLEARLCAGVLVAEIASLTLWISLKGLSADYDPGATAAGWSTAPSSPGRRSGSSRTWRRASGASTVHGAATTVAVILGLLAGRLWAHAGVIGHRTCSTGLQNASVLMLIGGLRGLATRLTLWVALLGASLATSRGKHIHVDVLIRYVPEKLRSPTAVIGQLAAMLVCIFGAIGFVDYIAISSLPRRRRSRARATRPSRATRRRARSSRR